MLVRKEQTLEERAFDLIEGRWKLIVVVAWLAFCAWYLWDNYNAVRFFQLGDTDDNMRMMQVRGLLHGQGWYDLRQHRLSPPIGANIHWSRLVDLPIAGLIIGLRPFLGGPSAERWAVGTAPLLPYLLLLFSLALTSRRLIHPRAYPLAFLALMFAGSTNGMFMPERIDHHGWQLALLALSVSAIADPKRLRGGITLGISSALSLAIGLEMIIYLALLGTAAVLFWVQDAEEKDRLKGYALSLGGTTGFSFLLFASYDNRAPVCDALSPVWLSDALLAGALMYGLAALSPGDWRRRLGLAVVAGAAIAGFHALAWPHCLQRLEGISPEAERLWLSYVKEARPVYRHGWRIATLIVALPITGLVGWGALAWVKRRDSELLRRILGAAAPALAASLLLLWQTRTGPAAQMLTLVGCTALTWLLIELVWNAKWANVQIGRFSPKTVVTALAAVIGLGAAVPLVLGFIPQPKPSKYEAAIGRANARCGSLWGMRPVALQPKGVVFTFVDLGPRLITVTHHDAIIGPYHRNGQQIVDVMSAFRGDVEQAHRLIAKYHSDYVLTCPKSSTTTIFMSETPKGFYGQLEAGRVPNWLQAVDLGKDSPFKMWRVVG